MLNKLLEFVTKEEERFYDLASKEMDRNSVMGNQVCIAQAASYQKVRYAIEDLMDKSKDNKLNDTEKQLLIQVAHDRVRSIDGTIDTDKHTAIGRIRLIEVSSTLSSAIGKLEKM